MRRFPVYSCLVACSVVRQSLREGCLDRLAISTPDVVRFRAKDDDGTVVAFALSIPFQKDDRTLCLDLLDLGYQFIKHGASLQRLEFDMRGSPEVRPLAKPR